VTTSYEGRRAELQALLRTNPAQIIAHFRGVSGLSTDGQLPYGVSFATMIEAILAFEQEHGQPGNDSQLG
jgi:hypothetical protein